MHTYRDYVLAKYAEDPVQKNNRPHWRDTMQISGGLTGGVFGSQIVSDAVKRLPINRIAPLRALGFIGGAVAGAKVSGGIYDSMNKQPAENVVDNQV